VSARPVTGPIEWFRATKSGEGLFVIEEAPHVQSYLVIGERRSALIDTGMGFSDIRAAVAPLARADVIVLNTHWHFDHVGGNALFEERGISPLEARLVERGWRNADLMSLYVNSCLSEDIPLPDGFLPEDYEIAGTQPTFEIHDGDTIDLGGRALEAIATPGHTHGSMSFLDHTSKSLLCGDLIDRGTLFANFEDSDIGEYIESLAKIHRRCGEFEQVLPSHNRFPLPADFVTRVRNAFEEIGGRLACGEDGGWNGGPTWRFVFDEFAVLAARPGFPGMRLRPD
jgi:glyoxylase-like metal-dependent hydrolase (beta-lactamase superfamily II)